MPSIRETALADIALVIDQAVLGQAVTLDGASETGVVTALSADEKSAMGFDGLNTEAVAAYFKTADMAAAPVPGQRVTMLSKTWDVVTVSVNGAITKMVLSRYAS